VAGHVLRAFSADEFGKLDNVVDNSARAVEVILLQGVQAAMNEFNNRDILT
jgi:peptidyl-tRNA hydrolase